MAGDGTTLSDGEVGGEAAAVVRVGAVEETVRAVAGGALCGAERGSRGERGEGKG